MPNGLHAEVETKNAGLDVRVKLFIEPGQIALSSEEVSQWVTSVYEDAQQILLQRVAVGETSALRLVRRDRRRWEPVPLDLEAQQSFEEEDAIIGATAAISAPEAMAAPAPSPAVESHGISTPSAPVPFSRRHRQGIERTRQGRNILAVLKESERPLDIATIKRQSKLTDYMTRTTLKALVAINLVIESEEEIGGRWGSKAVYALK